MVKENVMTEEEIQALKDELEGVKSEKETLTTEKEVITQELQDKAAAVSVLEATVSERDTAIATLTAEKETLGASIKAETQRTIDDYTDSYNLAVAAYKKAVAQANPGMPVELIMGDTIEAIDQSLVSSKALVDQVRAAIEAEIAAGRVPAGAPARTPPDLSALSPREKINYAITKEGGK
jgi:uncharacterized protein YoxC